MTRAPQRLAQASAPLAELQSVQLSICRRSRRQARNQAERSDRATFHVYCMAGCSHLPPAAAMHPHAPTALCGQQARHMRSPSGSSPFPPGEAAAAPLPLSSRSVQLRSTASLDGSAESPLGSLTPASVRAAQLAALSRLDDDRGSGLGHYMLPHAYVSNPPALEPGSLCMWQHCFHTACQMVVALRLSA